MDSNLVVFNHVRYTPQLQAQLAFLIQVKSLNNIVIELLLTRGHLLALCP